MQGRSVEEYRAPLFVAWQLTNRCSARCLACCEESGPDKAWRDELDARRGAAPRARTSSTLGIPYVAFGGGEPLGVAHCWEIFERPRGSAASRSSSRPTAAASTTRAADRLAALAVQCVQISVDGATRGDARARAARVELRGGRSARSSGSSRAACAPQLVFVPTRLNLARDRRRAYDLAASLGCERVRHRAADAHRPRRARTGTRSPAATTNGSTPSTRCASTRAVDARARSRCRSIRGTSSPRWRRASKARRRCCWSSRTARSSS